MMPAEVTGSDSGRPNSVGLANRWLGVCSLPEPRTIADERPDLPMDLPINQVGALLKCGDCGSVDVLVYPESTRDARKGRVR